MTTIPTFTTLGRGPTILMLHGIGGGHLAFAPQVETYASAGYRAVAWDMPGYGHSAPIEPYTFKGLAEACIRLIEALMAGDLERHRDERGEPDRPPRRAVPSQASPLGGQRSTGSDERGEPDRPPRRAAPSQASPLGGQRSTGSDERGEPDRPPRRAAPSQASPLGGQRSTGSDERGEPDRPPRRAVPSQASPLGGQRSTRSDERGGIILLGHSMGGMVAQEVVARRPDLVNRLILCGTSPSFGKPDGDWQRDFIASRTAPLDAGQTMAELAAMLVPQMIGPGSLPEGVTLASHCMAQVHPATYRRALQALVTFDRRASLADIHVPTLLVAGEHDRNAPPAVMQKMAEKIARSRYAEMHGIGHLQNLEAPEEFDALVLDFLANPGTVH